MIKEIFKNYLSSPIVADYEAMSITITFDNVQTLVALQTCHLILKDNFLNHCSSLKVSDGYISKFPIVWILAVLVWFGICKYILQLLGCMMVEWLVHLLSVLEVSGSNPYS